MAKEKRARKKTKAEILSVVFNEAISKSTTPILPRKQAIKQLVSSFYDMQAIRIQAGGRLVAAFYTKLGIQPGEKISDEKASMVLTLWANEYKKITDFLADNTEALKDALGESHLISSTEEFLLAEQYVDLLAKEKQLGDSIANLMAQEPIWNAFLKDVKGIGPYMAAVLVSSIDITKCTYVSNLWAYAGLGVMIFEDGHGERYSRKEAHLVVRDYINKSGEPSKKRGIRYNPFLKSKLQGVIAGSFLKSKNEKYSTLYYERKNKMLLRRESMIQDLCISKKIAYEDAKKEVMKNYPDKRLHLDASGYMLKFFLLDLYLAWRDLEKLPITEPYHIRVLKMGPHGQGHPQAKAA
jgi:hypothetical protein